MFDLSVATVGTASVMTSEKGGLSNDQIAEMLTNKLIYVSDDAPEPIRLQAEAFKEKVRNLAQYYIELARKEERATICAKVRDAGQEQLAQAIGRI
jgi:hypothetical protein|tara:strand:+ start:1100 stop:1387 length:288 start_codon:yes stop_codon:yes gene_type:complete